MENYAIVTDSASNLPHEMVEEAHLEILPLNYYVDGEEKIGFLPEEKIDLKPFYTMMREKKEITTSLPNVSNMEKTFRRLAEQGEDILYIGFSSGLSGTFQAANMIMNDLRKEFPEQKLYAIDTLAAALGEGLLVYYAIKNRNAGMSIEENVCWIEENKLRLCHWFTVDDLFFLKRGGRISATTAIVGTALKIKPVLHVDDEGHLIAMEKVRGRKKSLEDLVRHMEETIVQPENQVAFISHGDCLEDAEYVKKLVLEKFPVKDVFVHMLDPVIGAHSGPGTVALFYIGKER